jgi:hypothetical protein
LRRRRGLRGVAGLLLLQTSRIGIAAGGHDGGEREIGFYSVLSSGGRGGADGGRGAGVEIAKGAGARPSRAQHSLRHHPLPASSLTK